MNTYELKDEIPLLMEALCAYFDVELERQESILEVTRRQGVAARAHDVDGVREATAELSTLMQAALHGEQERLYILGQLVGHFGLRDASQQTLSYLISVSSEPWSGRMESFQTRIREVLTETRAVIQENASFLRRANRIVSNSVASIVGVEVPRGDAYDRDGRDPEPRGGEPALINTTG